MKTLVITAMLLIATLSYHTVQRGFEAHAEQKVTNYSPNTKTITYLSLEERLAIIEQLKQSVEDSYAALEIKKGC